MDASTTTIGALFDRDIMKRPTEHPVHLAWCILVAVCLARREGKAISLLETHVFIMQWLLNAQKRKIFPRAMAPDINLVTGAGKTLWGICKTLQ